MKNEHLAVRMLIGSALAVVINMCIQIGISAAVGDGSYYPAAPEAISCYGSELAAVVIQFVSMLCYGAVWGGASVIWDIARWSLLRQTATNLGLAGIATFVVLWLNFWVPHSAGSIIGFFVLFVAIYAVIWVSIYAATKRKIEALNRKMEQDAQKRDQLRK